MMNPSKKHLKNEKSPYLQQHVNNPVDWYPWKDEAFDITKSKNQPTIYICKNQQCQLPTTDIEKMKQFLN